MKHLIYLTFLLLIIHNLKGQNTLKDIPIKPYKNNYELVESQVAIIDKIPEFPGGVEALSDYLKNNLKYPNKAIEAKIEGKVFVSFIVNTEGYLKEIEVLRGLGYEIDKEVLRVILKMPKWKPAVNNGSAIDWEYGFPISFTLPKENSKNP